MNPNVFLGLFFCAISAVCLSLSSVMAKETGSIKVEQMSAYSSIGMLVWCLPSVILSKRTLFLPWRTFMVIFIRSTVITFFLMFKYTSLRYLPIGMASVIVYSDPVFVTIAAKLCLKEPCGIFQSVIIAITIAGVLLTADLPAVINDTIGISSNDLIIGTSTACASLFLGSVAWILLRQLKAIHSSVMMFHLGWISIIEYIIICEAMGGFQIMECGLQTWYVILIGGVSYLGQLFVILAVRRVFVGTVVTLRCALTISLNILWQIFFYKDIPDVYASCGMALVIVSVILVGFSNWLAIQPPGSIALKKLNWLSNVVSK